MKTLKDLNFNWHAGVKEIDPFSGKEIIISTVVNSDDLRDAAIGHIKELEESIDSNKHFVKDIQRLVAEAKIEWIKQFFNLEDK
jgi:hypothetical protein